MTRVGHSYRISRLRSLPRSPFGILDLVDLCNLLLKIAVNHQERSKHHQLEFLIVVQVPHAVEME